MICVMFALVANAYSPLDECKQCLLLTDQSQNRILIVDVISGAILWEWSAATSNIASDHRNWFRNPSDVKPVYNRKYLLVVASGGGVALVRISDRKTLFYAHAGWNPHSAELLPDGNLVSASSNGNELTVFKVDTLGAPNTGKKVTYFLEDGHNVVWDLNRSCLWATAGDTLKSFYYNNNRDEPVLIEGEKIMIPTSGSHDLFPVYGEDALWLSTVESFYRFDISSKTFDLHPSSLQENIKSISSGPVQYPTVVVVPKEQWWSDEVLDVDGNTVYKLSGLKIYKARWFLNNSFSYSEGHEINYGNDHADTYYN